MTVGAPFYNRVAIPIGLFLLFLTGVGPLLPWRATSFKAIKRNFVLPVIALWVTVIVCLAVGVRPWKDGTSRHGQLLCAGRICPVSRGLHGDCGGVSARRGVICAADRPQLFRRTLAADSAQHAAVRRLPCSHRRGGCCASGFAARPSIATSKAKWALHSKMNIGPYTLSARGFTQDSNLNYNSEYAVLDVSKGGKNALHNDAGEALLPCQRPAADDGGNPLGSRAGIFTSSTKAQIPILASRLSKHSSIRSSAGSGLASWSSLSAHSLRSFPASRRQPPRCAYLQRKPSPCCRAQGRRLMSASSNELVILSERSAEQRVEGFAVTFLKARLGKHSGFARGMKLVQALLLAVVVSFSLGATDASSRFNDLGHRLMCTCGCAQLLGECNHVGCPESRP